MHPQILQRFTQSTTFSIDQLSLQRYMLETRPLRRLTGISTLLFSLSSFENINYFDPHQWIFSSVGSSLETHWASLKGSLRGSSLAYCSPPPFLLQRSPGQNSCTEVHQSTIFDMGRMVQNRCHLIKCSFDTVSDGLRWRQPSPEKGSTVRVSKHHGFSCVFYRWTGTAIWCHQRNRNGWIHGRFSSSSERRCYR